MSDQRSAIAEFRELERRRLAGGLTSAEVARYDWLQRVLGRDVAPGQASPGFDMGAATVDLHESLLPGGLRDRPATPPAGPAVLNGLGWDARAQAAAPGAPFPDGGLDAAWLAEEPAPAVRPQAWNPAAPGYDPDAPYDEAAWIAAGYDPNVTYDWSAYGAQVGGGQPGEPAAEPPRTAPAPGQVVTAPAIPIPSSLVPSPELLADDDLPSLDVLPPAAAPEPATPGPVETGLSAVADFPITDAFLAPGLASSGAAPPASPPVQAAVLLAEDDGWPGFEPDPAVLPAAASEAGQPLDELIPLDPLADGGPPYPAPGTEDATFDGLISDEELLLLAGAGTPPEPSPGPAPQPPVAGPSDAAERGPWVQEGTLAEAALPEPPAPWAPPEAARAALPPTEVERPRLAEPAPLSAEPPEGSLPPLPQLEPAPAEAELPALALEPVQAVVPEPLLAPPPETPALAAAEPLHPPLPEAVRANVFVPPAPILAAPMQALAVEPLHPSPAPALTSEEAVPFEEAVLLEEDVPLEGAGAVEQAPVEEGRPPEAAAQAGGAAPLENAAPLVETWPPPGAAVPFEVSLAGAHEPALPAVLSPASDLPAEPVLGRGAQTSRQEWPAEPVFTEAPAPVFAPPAWPPLAPASVPVAAPAGFGAYDEAAPASATLPAGAPPADPPAGPWDAGGEPHLDPAIQPYEPAPPGTPLGEYDDLPLPPGRGLESMLPFDPAAAAAIRPGSVPEGYENGAVEEPVISLGLELPGRPVPPAAVGPVAELSEVSAEWQPDAALARGFDLASEGSFGLPELSLGETPAWPPPGPPSPPPFALPSPSSPAASSPAAAPGGQPPPPPGPEEEVLEVLSPEELVEQPLPSLELTPSRQIQAPAAGRDAPPAAGPARPPADVFVAPEAGLFGGAAAHPPRPPAPAAAPRPASVFVPPAADLFARPGPAAPPTPPPPTAPAASSPPALHPVDEIEFDLETPQPSPAAAAGHPATSTPAAPAAPPARAPVDPALGAPTTAGKPPASPSDRWSVPLAPAVPRLQPNPPAQPPVLAPAPPPTADLDLEPLPPLLGASRLAGSHRVLVHTVDGEVKRGLLNDPALDAAQLTLRPQGPGAPQVLATESVKAVFFLLAPGERPPRPDGRKVRVTFRDGRQVVGVSPDYREGQIGFMLIPVEARTTTARIWVYQASVRQVVVG